MERILKQKMLSKAHKSCTEHMDKLNAELVMAYWSTGRTKEGFRVQVSLFPFWICKTADPSAIVHSCDHSCEGEVVPQSLCSGTRKIIGYYNLQALQFQESKL